MPKLKQNINNNKLLQSVNYLAAAIGCSKVEIVDRLTERLNKAKKKSKHGSRYTSAITTCVVYGKYDDKQVEFELLRWEGEVKGVQVQVNEKLDEARHLISSIA